MKQRRHRLLSQAPTGGKISWKRKVNIKRKQINDVKRFAHLLFDLLKGPTLALHSMPHGVSHPPHSKNTRYSISLFSFWFGVQLSLLTHQNTPQTHTTQPRLCLQNRSIIQIEGKQNKGVKQKARSLPVPWCSQRELGIRKQGEKRKRSAFSASQGDLPPFLHLLFFLHSLIVPGGRLTKGKKKVKRWDKTREQADAWHQK
jgi:hypothetical protein